MLNSTEVLDLVPMPLKRILIFADFGQNKLVCLSLASSLGQV
jgi:hypothetical protein